MGILARFFSMEKLPGEDLAVEFMSTQAGKKSHVVARLQFQIINFIFFLILHG